MKGNGQVRVMCNNNFFGYIDPWDVNVECDYWLELGCKIRIDEKNRTLWITNN